MDFVRLFKINVAVIFLFLFFLHINSAEAGISGWRTPLQDGVKETELYKTDETAYGSSGDIAIYIGKILIIAPFFGMVFLIRMVWAGYIWMTAAGDSEKVDEARRTITHAFVGLVLFATSYIIIYFLLTTFSSISGYKVSNK
jgi:hypothetical protein